MMPSLWQKSFDFSYMEALIYVAFISRPFLPVFA